MRVPSISPISIRRRRISPVPFISVTVAVLPSDSEDIDDILFISIASLKINIYKQFLSCHYYSMPEVIFG